MPGHADFVAPPAVGESSPFAALSCRFDYVLMLEAGADPDAANFGKGWLTTLKVTDMAALYSVDPPPCGCPATGSPFVSVLGSALPPG